MYYRFYNNSLGLLPTYEILMSWYDVNIDVPLLFRKSKKITKPIVIPEITLGTNGFTISFFIQLRSKKSTLYSFGDDVYGKIEDDVFIVNETKVNRRITNNTNYFIVIQTLPSGRTDVYVDTKRVTQIVGKSYPQNFKRTSNIIGSGITDFCLYQEVF